MTAREIKRTLASGGRVWGTFFQHATDPKIADLLPAQGLDFVIVNTEHNPLNLSDYQPMRYALASKGIACLVRVHSRDLQDIRRACDSFPDGVVVPYVEDVEELKRIAAAVKCRPLSGQAFERMISTGQWPSEEARTYCQAKCADTLLCPMIESVEAMENLDELCSVPGIDAVFIGPNDMTCSMGIPEQHDDPRYIDVIQRLIDTAERHGIAAGCHCWAIPHAQRMIDQGARFIPFSTDGRFLQGAMTESLRTLRGDFEGGAEQII